MADFTPIGVEAVVRGLDSFTSDMNQMGGTVEESGSWADSAGTAFVGLGNSVLQLGAMAAGAALAGITALGAGLASAVGEAIEAETNMARVEQVIKSTGGAAGITAEEAGELATSFSQLTTFSDDAVLAAEAVLLRFQNIGEDVFPQATQITLDLATALGIDASQAALMLGKALETPGEGLARLKMAGVSFTQEQEDMIKAMVEAGDVAGAQKLILDALAETVGGAAAAAAETFAGRMEQMKNRLGEAKEAIGTAFLPILSTAFGFIEETVLPILENFANYIVAVVESGDTLNDYLAGVPAFLQPVVEWVGKITAAFVDLTSGDVRGALDNIFPPEVTQQILEFAQAVQALVADTIIPFVQDHAEEIKGAIVAIGAVLAAAGIVAAIVGIGGAIAALANPITLIIGAAAALGAAWAGDWAGIRTAVTGWWETSGKATFENIMAVMQELASRVIPFVAAQFEKISAWYKENKPLIEAFTAKVVEFFGRFMIGAGMLVEAIVPAWAVIQPILSALFEIILQIGTLIMQVATGDWAGAWATITGIVDTAWTGIQAAFTAFADWVAGWFGTSWAGIVTTWQANWDNFQAILSMAWEAMTGFITGGLEEITGAWKTGWKTIGDVFSGWWNNTVAPIFNTLKTWFTVTIPEAIGVVVGFWQNVLQTGIQTVMDFINGTVFAVFTTLSSWFTTTIPGAITTANTALATLKAAFETVKAFVADTLQPVFDALKGFLEGAFTTAVNAVGLLWSGDLKGAFETVKNFVIDFLQPGLDGLRAYLEGAFTTATNAIETAWTNIKTAFNDAATAAKEGLKQGLETLANYLSGAFESTVSGVIGPSGVLSKMATAFTSIATAISTAWTNLTSLLSAVSAAVLPTWLQTLLGILGGGEGGGAPPGAELRAAGAAGVSLLSPTVSAPGVMASRTATINVYPSSELDVAAVAVMVRQVLATDFGV